MVLLPLLERRRAGGLGRTLTAALRRTARGRALGVGLALGALLCLGACDSATDEADRPTPEEYVDVYVEILQAAGNAPDSIAASDSARRILAERGLSEEDLLGFARRHADDPRVLADAWRNIEERLRNPQREDTTADTTGVADTAAAIRRERR